MIDQSEILDAIVEKGLRNILGSSLYYEIYPYSNNNVSTGGTPYLDCVEIKTKVNGVNVLLHISDNGGELFMSFEVVGGNSEGHYRRFAGKEFESMEHFRNVYTARLISFAGDLRDWGLSKNFV